MEKANAIVIASGKIADPAFLREAGAEVKSLVHIAGKPLVSWVVDALRASESIEKIALVTRWDLPATNADHLVRGGVDDVENLILGAAAFDRLLPNLMVWADMALLTPAAIDDLIENSPPAEVVYPLVSREAVLRAFPGRPWGFMRLAEGTFTSSGCFVFDPRILVDHRGWLERIFAVRRNPAELAKIVFYRHVN